MILDLRANYVSVILVPFRFSSSPSSNQSPIVLMTRNQVTLDLICLILHDNVIGWRIIAAADLLEQCIDFGNWDEICLLC